MRAVTPLGLRARRRDGVSGARALEKRPPNGSCGHRVDVSDLNLPCHLFLYDPQTNNGFHIFKWLYKYLHNILEFAS